MMQSALINLYVWTQMAFGASGALGDLKIYVDNLMNK